MLNYKKPELLSPAGSVESVYAAVNNGCDAVYIGGKRFSARQYAGNFSDDELENICDYCHLRGVKVYITVNTLYKDTELADFLKFIEFLYKIGADAVILQDLGSASLIRKYFPDFKIHGSTQLTTNNLLDVKFLESVGFSKAVLSRELSLDEIVNIKKNSEIDIETFIHGALCVSYSGQCIMSSMIGGRSGNRGRCAQTCRLPYELINDNSNKIAEGYLLSPKDIQTVNLIPELIGAGIDSFKIEGRMKSPEYVAGVTSIYRKYIDLYFENPDEYSVDNNDIKILLQLFNRGGFSEGYYKSHAGKNMMSIQRPKHWGLKAGFVDTYDKKHGKVFIRTREPFIAGDGIEIWTDEEPHVGSGISKQSKAGEVINLSIEGNISKNNIVYKTHDKLLSDKLKKTWEKDTRKIEIFASVKAYAGENISLKLWDKFGNFVYIKGDMVSKAENQPTSAEKIKKQITKTGSTSFFVNEISIDSEDDIYIGIGSLNELRRNAVKELEEKIINSYKREPITVNSAEIAVNPNKVIKKKTINISICKKEQFDIIYNKGCVNIIYFELNDDFIDNFNYYCEKCKEENIKLFIALPRIDREYIINSAKAFLEKNLHNDYVYGFLIRSLGEYMLVKDYKKSVAFDYNINTFNSRTINFLNDLNPEIIALSPELNLEELKNSSYENCELFAYGYLPVMVTHQCPIGEYCGGKEDGIFCSEKNTSKSYFLKDRKGIRFPIVPHCSQCFCEILNSKPVFTLKFFNEIIETPAKYIRLSFTKENAYETQKIFEAYKDVVENINSYNQNTLNLIKEMGENRSTKGHFFRGVE